jgi:hypothetical protein
VFVKWSCRSVHSLFAPGLPPSSNPGDIAIPTGIEPTVECPAHRNKLLTLVKKRPFAAIEQYQRRFRRLPVLNDTICLRSQARAAVAFALLVLLYLVPAGTAAGALKLLAPETGWVTSLGHLYWTSDGGDHWTDITPTPPEVPHPALGAYSSVASPRAGRSFLTQSPFRGRTARRRP